MRTAVTRMSRSKFSINEEPGPTRICVSATKSRRCGRSAAMTTSSHCSPVICPMCHRRRIRPGWRCRSRNQSPEPLRKSGLRDVVTAVAEVAGTLAHLRDEFQIYHRDVKPSNLYLLEGRAAISDFVSSTCPILPNLPAQVGRLGLCTSSPTRCSVIQHMPSPGRQTCILGEDAMGSRYGPTLAAAGGAACVKRRHFDRELSTSCVGASPRRAD